MFIFCHFYGIHFCARLRYQTGDVTHAHSYPIHTCDVLLFSVCSACMPSQTIASASATCNADRPPENLVSKQSFTMCDIVCEGAPQDLTDLKPDSSGRGWLHIDPGQCESGSTLITSVDVGRIQKVQ